MVHRPPLQVLALACALLTLASCSDKKTDSAVAAVCDTRSRTQSAVNSSSTASVDQYPEVIRGLEDAIKVAPAGIKADFVTVHDVLKPFVDALVKANGNTEVAARDPNYASIVAAVGTKSATTAARRIRNFYADHC